MADHEENVVMVDDPQFVEIHGEPAWTGSKLTRVWEVKVTTEPSSEATFTFPVGEVTGASTYFFEEGSEGVSAMTFRRALPIERPAVVKRFEIRDGRAEHPMDGYFVVGLYPDGMPGEIFIQTDKMGSIARGFSDIVATLLSVLLQLGVPLDYIVSKFSHTRFGPEGFTGDSDVPVAKSMVDYLCRWMEQRFLTDPPCSD